MRRKNRQVRLTLLLAGLRWLVSALILLGVLAVSYLIYSYVEYVSDNDASERLVVLPAAEKENNNTTVVAIDSAKNTALIMQLDPNVIIPLAQGRGSGRVGSLSTLESDPKLRDKLVKDSFQKALGWSIDNVIITPSDSRLPELVVRQAVSFRLNWWQAWIILKALKKQGVETEIVNSQRFISRITDVDGLMKEEWSTERWDIYVQTSGIMPRLNEGVGVSVAIINTTDQTGLGALVGRMMSNNGFDVVSVKTEDDKEGSDALIWTNRELHNHYRSKLKSMFPLVDQTLNPSAGGRADLIIRVGASQQQRW